MRTLLLLLSMCVTALAQPGPIALRSIDAWPSASIVVPSNIASGLRYWWVNHDLDATNFVTNWIDRISSSVWTNGDIANAPTNSATGVFFKRTGSQVLTNSGVVLGANTADPCSHWYIVNLASGNACGWLTQSRTLAAGGFGFVAAPNPFLAITPSFVQGPKIPITTTIDIACTARNSGAAYEIVWYTNGVIFATNANFTWFGTVSWKSLGGDTADGFYNGRVQELAIWSNTVLSSVNISNLHYYATNTYGFTP